MCFERSRLGVFRLPGGVVAHCCSASTILQVDVIREIMTLPMHPPMSGGRHISTRSLIIPLVRLVTILSLLVTSSRTKVAATATSVADSAADISITTTGFQPADLTVTAGTPVVWVNGASKSHTLASGEVRRLYMPLILCGVSRSLTSTASAPNTAQSAVYEPMQPAAEPLFRVSLAPGEPFAYTYAVAGIYPHYLADDLRFTGRVVVRPPAIPPDPSTVAPLLDPTVPTTIITATKFLYTGPQPIQTGVAPGTMEPKRVAVLHGRV